MATTLPVNLTRLREDIQRAYDSLTKEQYGTLSARQRQRLDEIQFSIDKVNDAIEGYESALRIPAAERSADPRYRLMYAARTPMEMVLQCAYFLHINSMRKTEPLNNDQMEAVWLVERSGRKLVLEIERLWADMKAEVQKL